MTRPSDHATRLDGAWGFGVCALVFVALDVWMRWPGLSSQGFASHDVAGMTYNGMLIGLGELPYVDSIELKAPGGFYLAALVQAFSGGPGVESVTALVRMANILATGVMVVLMSMAWRAWGLRSAVVVGGVYVLGAGYLDSMDANYVTWANAWAVVAMALAWRADGDARSGLGAWLWVGVFAGAAALTKRPVGIVLPVTLVWAYWSVHESKLRTLRSFAVLGGVAFVHLPVLLHYAGLGQVSGLVQGYVLNEWGGAYVARKSVEVGPAVLEGVSATLHFLALPVALAGLSAIAFHKDSQRVEQAIEARRVRVLLLWTAATWAACFVGWRFYKGYFVPVLPALALLAAHPSGLLRMIESARRERKARILGVLIAGAIGLLAVRQVALVDRMRVDRAWPHDVGGRKIADYVAPKLEANDRIWVWGWHLWDVYTYAATPSASRIYKSLGLLTPPNDDTWRGGGSRLHFVDGAPAELLLEDFAAHPPRFIVLGSTVPHREFKALRQLLRSDYRRVRGPRIGRVQYWERRTEGVASP